MAWIGLLGAKAVAGVGVGGMFTWLSQGLASMARMGGQVQIAQCIGTRREGKGTWICTDSDAVGIIDGTRIWDHCSTICKSAGWIFQAG